MEIMKGRKMKKVAITILVLMCNQAFGLTLMGPPMAELEQGQHSAGIDFSYGDIMRLNLSDNYKGTIKSEDAGKWTLELTAKSRTAPYYKVIYEIKKDGHIVIKGACFSKSNKLIKTMVYSNIKNFNNKLKPATITVTSPYHKGRISIMTLENEEYKDLPDNVFNKRNLPRRLEERY